MLHVCCNAYRKRAYTAQYQDLPAAFRVARLDQVCLEHCTLSYDMITLWDTWDFTGEFAVGVIDQRNDGIESDEEIACRAGRRWLVFRRNASFLPRSVVFSTFRSMSPGRSCARW